MRILPTLLCLSVAALGAVPRPARAERLDTTVVLGGSAKAAVSAAGDVATVGFLVTEGVGRKLRLKVTRTKKPASPLVPDVTVIAPDGTPFSALQSVSKPGAALWKATLTDVPQTGLWRLAVRGDKGTTGGFTATVAGKDTNAAKETVTILGSNGKADVEILAGENAALTVTTRRVGFTRTVVPKLEIFDASGLPVGAPVIANAKTGVLNVAALRLPLFGHYTLHFTGANDGSGQFAFTAKTAPAKLRGVLPTADPGSAVEVEPGLVAHLDGSRSSSGSGLPLAYHWAQVGGKTTPLTGADSAAPSFTAPTAEGLLAFQLSVTEGSVLSRTATVGVAVAKRPVADAGRSFHAANGAAATLDGSASIPRHGSVILYSWRQVPGDSASVTLRDAATAHPSFDPPAGEHVLHFGLVVDDGSARSFEDVVVVSVGSTVHAVADAGREQYVSRMAGVHLSGLASTTLSGVLEGPMLWTQVAGPPLTDRSGNPREIESKDTPWASFTAPRSPADLQFKLTVGGDESTADFVWVHVRSGETNLPAPATGNGPLNTQGGDVALVASALDADRDPLSFRWCEISGAALALSSPSSAEATTTVTAGNAQYLFAVQTNDGLQYGAPDLVAIRNAGYSGLPLALAGADTTLDLKLNPDAAAVLDGRTSVRTSGSGPLTYRWTQVSGRDWFDVAANAPSFDATAARTSFAMPRDISSLTTTRTMLFQLVVDDGTNSSLPDLVAVTFTNLLRNAPPVVTAAASDANPIVGQQVTLTGTKFDRDGDDVTVRWTQTAGLPLVELLPNATALSPTFIAPDGATPLTFQIVGKDGLDDSVPKTVNVLVDRKPKAVVAVNPPQGGPGTEVTMDGTGSNDPEGKTLTYAWTELPSGSVVSHDSIFTFTAPNGPVSYQLVVNDGRQDSDPRIVGFAQTPPPTVNPSASALDTVVMGAPPYPGDLQGYAAYGSTMTLSANPSAGGPFTFTWRVISQTPSTMPAIVLSSPTAQSPTFTVPLPGSSGFGATPMPQATFGVIARDSVQPSAERTLTVRFFATLANGTNSQSQNNVYAIISRNCATSCHAGTGNFCPVNPSGSTTNASGFGMGTKTAFLKNSRGVASCGTKSRLPAAAVPPLLGQSTLNSELFDSITGIAALMPPSGGALSTAEINLIKDWIDQGVLDN